jgi:SpoVK/Ycf46/Vps4 family AAA+-type ATPase
MIKTCTPDLGGRVDILKKMLAKETLTEDVDVLGLAQQTDNYSGSDLREFVRLATTLRAKELVAEAQTTLARAHEEAEARGVRLDKHTKLTLPSVRPLCHADFLYSLGKVPIYECLRRTARANAPGTFTHTNTIPAINRLIIPHVIRLLCRCHPPPGIIRHGAQEMRPLTTPRRTCLMMRCDRRPFTNASLRRSTARSVEVVVGEDLIGCPQPHMWIVSVLWTRSGSGSD